MYYSLLLNHFLSLWQHFRCGNNSSHQCRKPKSRGDPYTKVLCCCKYYTRSTKDGKRIAEWWEEWNQIKSWRWLQTRKIKIKVCSKPQNHKACCSNPKNTCQGCYCKLWVALGCCKKASKQTQYLITRAVAENIQNKIMLQQSFYLRRRQKSGGDLWRNGEDISFWELFVGVFCCRRVFYLWLSESLEIVASQFEQHFVQEGLEASCPRITHHLFHGKSSRELHHICQRHGTTHGARRRVVVVVAAAAVAVVAACGSYRASSQASVMVRQAMLEVNLEHGFAFHAIELV